MTSVMVAIATLALSLSAMAQDQPKAEKQKVNNPEVIQPSTACEGITGALPEAISECQKRETARLLIILGKTEAATKVLCTTKAARDAFGGDLVACQKSN